ncbi:MAG TPA: sigma-70 family RNA polymerase sigma factor [Pyrinomonadaceae bacterium]|nr:sigma-70 family RNA polymerase sigma factor [Pyrinomonadaceae bacterium]
MSAETAALTEREGRGRRPHLKRAWELTQGAFDRLLAQLDPDAQKAGEKYKTVHRSLSKFFECRGCASSDELADETLNRVARRLEDGETIYAEQFAAYAYGVARNVLREHARGPEPRTHTLDALPPPSHPRLSPFEEEESAHARESAERRLECLETCAGALPAESRELILSYYEGGAGERIARRRQLAERLGIPLNNLRIRAHRIRERLEKCVGACVGRG